VLVLESLQTARLGREMEAEDLVAAWSELARTAGGLLDGPRDAVVAWSPSGGTLLFAGRPRPEDDCAAAVRAASALARRHRELFGAWLDPEQPALRFGLSSGRANTAAVSTGRWTFGVAAGRPLNESVANCQKAAGDELAMGRHSHTLLGQGAQACQRDGLWRLGLDGSEPEEGGSGGCGTTRRGSGGES
jgi:class 3 adenylate cyclase